MGRACVAMRRRRPFLQDAALARGVYLREGANTLIRWQGMNILQHARDWARRIKRDAVTLWFAYRDPRTPILVKALCVFVVAYALSPIDLIPDFIPILGYLDDVILLPGLIWLAVRLLPPAVLQLLR